MINQHIEAAITELQEFEEVLSWLSTKACWELGELEYKLDE